MSQKYKLITEGGLYYYFDEDDDMEYVDRLTFEYKVCKIADCMEKLLKITKQIEGNNITKQSSCGIDLCYDLGYILGCMMFRGHGVDTTKSRIYVMLPAIEVRNRFMELSNLILPSPTSKKMNRVIGLDAREKDLYTVKLVSEKIIEIFDDLNYHPRSKICPDDIENTPLDFREGMVAGLFDSQLNIRTKPCSGFKDMTVKICNLDISMDLNRLMASVDIGHKYEITKYQKDIADRIRINANEVKRRRDFFDRLVNPALIVEFKILQSIDIIISRRDLVPFNYRLSYILLKNYDIDIAPYSGRRKSMGRHAALRIASSLKFMNIDHDIVNKWLDILYDPNIRFAFCKKIISVKNDGTN